MCLSSLQWLFAFLVLFALCRTGSCLECYTCASPNDGNCGDESGTVKVPALPCQSHQTMCFKGTMTVLGTTVVTRGCTSEDPCQLFNSCSICKENRCNSATSLTPPFMILTIVGLAVLKFYI